MTEATVNLHVAAAAVGVTKRSLYLWMRAGKLP
jgi:predicted site-specific integrase-resolvase